MVQNHQALDAKDVSKCAKKTNCCSNAGKKEIDRIKCVDVVQSSSSILQFQ